MQQLSVADLLRVASTSFYLEMEPSAFSFPFFLDGGLSPDKKADGESGGEAGAAEIWSKL